jgi:hypothetical protein
MANNTPAPKLQHYSRQVDSVEKAKPRRQAGLRLPALAAAELAIEIALLLAALLLAGLLPTLLLLLAGLLVLIPIALLLTRLRVVLLLLIAVGILVLLRHFYSNRIGPVGKTRRGNPSFRAAD